MEGADTADFLATRSAPDGCTAIVTNPPYKLAAEFIERALSFDLPFVAILLKSTFWHAKRRQGLFERRPPTHIHPLTWRPDFMNLGAPTMETMWCAWDAGLVGDLPVYQPLHREG